MSLLRLNFAPVALAFVAGSIVCGCTNPLVKYRTSLQRGQYDEAAAVATDKISPGSNDELMWRLLSGGANRLTGNSSAALEQFDRAEDVMIARDGASVFSKGATGTWAMMTNDKAFPYIGCGQDRIFTCLYKAIDFAANGKTDAARTELNRAAQHQENWLFERRKEIAAAQDRLKKDAKAYQKSKQSETSGAKDQTVDCDKTVSDAFADDSFSSRIKDQCGFDTATSGNLDSLQPVDWMNPYVSHVTGIFRWLNGDAAQNYLKDTVSCQQGSKIVARDLAECEKGKKPRDQVWVWIEDGLCPYREEWRIDLPLFLIPYNKYVYYAGMALPYLVTRDPAGNNWSVTAGSTTVQADELLDVDEKVKLEYDVYFRGALTREITRTVVKVGTQVALGVVAENVSDRNTKLALKLSQAAAATWAASVTAADTRSWESLPKKVHVVRLTRPDNGVISISNSAGSVTEVTVPKGNSMVFVSKPTVIAPASVKVVTY